jgi:endonuclease/exonuclease/phosphatase (EEP) superfamily protein YafD
MTSPGKDNVAADSRKPIEGDYAEVASLATKVAALPHHLEPSSAIHSRDWRDTSTIASRSPRRTRGFVYWLVWLVTISLVVAALLRIFYHDGTHLLNWINAFTRYVYLPAYFCLAWAAWKRRWVLAFVNVAIIGWHLSCLAPDFIRDRRFETIVDGAAAEHAGPRVRIFFANVRASNTEYESMLGEIRDANPDIVLLAEFLQPWFAAFRDAPAIAAYPYGSGHEPARMETINVFSKLPLKSEKKLYFAGRGIELIEIPVGSKTLQIASLHSPRPIETPNNNYDLFWIRTIPAMLAIKGPLVVVGDFNSTQYSLVYNTLTADRLRSAHEDRGRGFATTWPNGQYLAPPIRIDQALISPEVECLDIKEGEGRGSDHKPLILDVQLR